MTEAAAQLQKGLDQLALLPDDPKRQRRELELRSALGAVFMAVKGFAAPDTGNAYARARELWERLGSPSEYLHIPYGQSRYHMVRGELDLALRSAEDLLRLSRRRGMRGRRGTRYRRRPRIPLRTRRRRFPGCVARMIGCGRSATF